MTQLNHMNIAVAGPWIDVKVYNAKGNGTTDDTAAIQAAINAACVSGGTVLFPAGTYKITSSLTITGSVSNVALIGEGRAASVILCNFAGPNPALSMNPLGDHFIIERLGFQGNNLTGGSGNGNAISVFTPSGFNPGQLIIRDCRVEGFRGQGVDSTSTPLPTGSAGIYLQGGTALFVEDTFAGTCGVALFGDTVEKGGAHYFTGDNCDANALYLRNCEQWSFTQCIFNGSGNGGSTQGDVYLANNDGITFYGCRIKNGGPYNVDMLTGNVINHNISFVDCHINQLATVGIGAGHTSILASNSTIGLKIDGCKFKFVNTISTAIGIDLEQGAAGYEASGHIYRDNTFIIGDGGTISACVKLNVSSNKASGVEISGNTFGDYNVGLATTIAKGVWIAGNSSGTKIRRNVFASDGVNLTIQNAIYFDDGITCTDTEIDGNQYSPFGGITTVIRDPGTAGAAYIRKNEGGIFMPVDQPSRISLTTITGGTVTLDCAVARKFIVTAGSGVGVVSFNNPANFWVAGDGAKLQVTLKNASGGAVSFGWGANINQSFVSPADGFNRTFELTFDLASTTWYMTGMTPLDVPN